MKKLQILFLLAAAIALVFTTFACDDDGSDLSTTGPYDTYGNGPYRSVEQDLSSGPGNASGLWYPDGDGPFPVFLWGCGGGSQPSAYVDHFQQLATWGFVIIAQVSTGSGTELTNALDWITQQNSNSRSPLYRKLDLSKVAAGGHSMGSITTFNIADDPRLSTTIHVAGGHGGNGGSGGCSTGGCGGAPTFGGSGPENLRNPTAYICGANDQLGATDNAELDYADTTVPVYFTKMRGVDHIMAAREGLPAITAWLLWHLKGETQRKADFLNPNGEFQTGIFNSEVKNW